VKGVREKDNMKKTAWLENIRKEELYISEENSYRYGDMDV